MVANDPHNISGSPIKVEVGEIDTRAPFQSVKDAVSLFGEGALSRERPVIKNSRPHSAERVLAKETQLHLAQKELNKLKDQLKNAETTTAQALVELEKAKRTVEDLIEKLKYVTESKELTAKATEAVKATGGNPENGSQKQDLESRREEYVSAIAELDAAKQLLRQIRQERDATVEAKATAFKQVGEAEDAAKANIEKAEEISREIKAVQELIGQVKLATIQAQQEHSKIFTEKDIQKQSYKAILEDLAKKVILLKKDFTPEIAQNLEAQLTGAMTEVGTFQKEMENAKASDIDSVNRVTLELDGEKESLEKVVIEKSTLKSLLESLEIELEKVKKEHNELKEKEDETENLVENLHVKLQKAKSELETAFRKECKVKSAFEEMTSTLHQLLSERENARSEAEEMKNKAQELKNEIEAARIAVEEAEKHLEVALEETEEAKAAEKRALNQIHDLSERRDAARASTSESGAKITILKEEFEALSRKVEESNMLAEMKVAAAFAQVDAVKASESEAVKKLEVTQKEINEVKAATQEAIKKAEMAEAAKKAVEGELRRWREGEQKKAAEADSNILVEREIQKQDLPEKVEVVKKLEKQKTFLSKKVLLHNLSGIFLRKRNQIEGASQSYLPGVAPTS